MTPILYCPRGDPLEERNEVSLFFCRDPTLSLFYPLFIISAQLYISHRKPSPLINPLTLTPSASVSKYPYYGLSLSSRIPWDPVFF